MRIAPGGRRGNGDNRYGDGPSGRLNPRAPSSPPGRLAAPGIDPGRAGGSIGTDLARPGGRLRDIDPPRTDLPSSIGPRATPTSGNGYVTPGSGTTIVTPTITVPSASGYYGNSSGTYYSPYSPYSSWTWYAWCSPYYLSTWFWHSYYPSYYPYSYSNGFYIGGGYGSPTVVDNRTIIIDSGASVVGEGSVLYESPENFEGSRIKGERSPEERMDLTTAADSYLQLGDRAFRERRYGDSVHFYAKAIEFSPEEGALYLVLADALFATGDYHYAAYAIRRSLEIDPTLINAEVDKHLFYGSPEDFDKQLRVLETYVRDHPTDNDSRLVLALNMLFGLRAQDAVRILENQFTQSVSDDPAAALILQQARQRAE